MRSVHADAYEKIFCKLCDIYELTKELWTHGKNSSVY